LAALSPNAEAGPGRERMESRIVIKLIEAAGWYEVGHEGSHKQF
jgi:predicted RNA binding protein YcfA (HicA-like mRNA interferase family)